MRPPVFQVDAVWPTIPNNWVLGEVTSIAVDPSDFVDAKGFVWISGNGGWPKPSGAGSGDDMILKFTPQGKLVMQIGKRGQSTGNADTMNVHQPAEGDGPQQFGLVHAVKVSNDGVVYVADRTNNRIQTFSLDGKFLRQTRIALEGTTNSVPAGFTFSPDKQQQFLYVVDSGPMRVVIFDRRTLAQIGSVGMRGAKPGEFDIVHHMAADSKGDLYTAEIVTNRRAQRFVLK